MNKKVKRTLIITGLCLLLFAGVCALSWCLITGFNLIKWFTSETAYIVYFLILIYIGFVGWAFLSFKN